jgi:glycosyltransferase involved in cell wall biosynthesis
MQLDVLIPTFNRAASLARTLDSLQSARVPAGMKVTVTVINNNCTDGTEALVASRMHNDDRIRHLFEGQQGRSPALNAGVAATSGDLVGMVDDDEEIDATWYEVVWQAFSDPSVDFIGGPYIPRWASPPPPWLPKEYGGVVGWVDGGDREVPYDPSYDGVLMGGNAVIRRRVMEQVGPYATSLGRKGHRLLSGEDRDYYYRLLNAGAMGRYLPQLVIYHHIPAERCTKAYFRRWLFWHGVSLGMSGSHEDFSGPKLLRVPRWRFKSAAKGLLLAVKKLVRPIDPARAFAEELLAWELAGALYGANVVRKQSSESALAR